jgi:hypothetical protein
MRGEATIRAGRRFCLDPLVSEGKTDTGSNPFEFRDGTFRPPPGNHWKLTQDGLNLNLPDHRCALHQFLIVMG